MDGDITVESEYGKGSAFTVTLPQEILNHDKIAEVANPDDKTVLIYERRAVFAFSIARTLDNLGVKFALASSEDEFFSMMKNKSFSFIFVSFVLFEMNKETVLESISNSQIVLLTEFGESVPPGNWRTLSLPAHAISVSGILNNEPDSYTYKTKEGLSVQFTAPEANVLVVDDIRTNLKVANGLLSPYRMNVDLCNGGNEAIEAIKTKRYDIVFMDHRMPGIDGVMATKLIRALGSEDAYYLSVPIVVLTANAVSGMREMFLKSGFDDFLSKPIDIVKLNSILEKWIPKDKQLGFTAEQVQSLEANETDSETDGFKTMLLYLKTSLESRDIDEVNKTTGYLLKTAQSDEVLAVIRKISKQILMAEYNEAEKSIENLLLKGHMKN